jgi:hypothetical protein
MANGICPECVNAMKIKMLVRAPVDPRVLKNAVPTRVVECIACKLCQAPIGDLAEPLECSEFIQREEPILMVRPEEIAADA